MPFYVYILHSTKLDRFYVGTTDDVVKRLQQHNNILYPNAFTTKGIPWTLYSSIPCSSSEQAYRLEKFIKQMKSKAFIKKIEKEPKMVNDLLRRFH
jgi:putative endonuclease